MLKISRKAGAEVKTKPEPVSVERKASMQRSAIIARKMEL